MSIPTTITFIGTIGGVDTARLSLEFTAALATDDRDVAVLDVAFATQGFLGYVSGTLDFDVTALVTDVADVPLESGLITLETDAEGHAAVYSAAAPFEWLTWAMTPDVMRMFEGRIAEAADGFDHVLIDTPLLASNQTVIAVTTCDRVALVTPVTDRGADAADRSSARAADIDADIDATVSAFGALDDADVVVPETRATGLANTPTCREDAELATGIAAVTEVFLGIEIDAVTATDGVLDSVSKYVHC